MKRRRTRLRILAILISTVVLPMRAAIGQGPRPLAYATSEVGVGIIDTSTNSVVGSIVLPERPTFLSMSPDATRLYATSESHSIAVIDVVQERLLTVIQGTPRYTGVAFSPDGGTVYALRYLADPVSSISVLDAAANQIVGDIPLDEDIFARMAISPDGKSGYVPRSFPLGNPLEVLVVDLEGEAVDSAIVLPGGSATFDLAFTNEGRRLWVPILGGAAGGVGATATAPAELTESCTGDCDGDGQVQIDEAVSGVRIALAGRGAALCARFDVNADDEVAIDELVEGIGSMVNGCPAATVPTGNYAAIIDTRTNGLFRVLDFGSTSSGVAAADGRAAGTGGGLPGLGIEVSPDERFAYVTSCGEGLCVIDLSSADIVDTVAIPGFPYNIAVTPDGRTAYVTDNGSGPISIVDLEQRAVVGDIELGGTLDIVVGTF